MLFEGSFHSCLRSFHLCTAVEYQLYHSLLNCKFIPREAHQHSLKITWMLFFAMIATVCVLEVIGNLYFWRRTEQFTCPGTPNAPVSLYERFCRHEGSQGICVLGRGQHSVDYFVIVQQHVEVESAFLTCVLHSLHHVRSWIYSLCDICCQLKERKH